MQKINHPYKVRTVLVVLLSFLMSAEMLAKEELTTFTGFHATAGSRGIAQNSNSEEDYNNLVDGQFSSTDNSDWSKWCSNSKDLKEDDVNYYYVDSDITGNNADCKGSVSANYEEQGGLANGSGTKEDPYQIANEDDWNLFATKVANDLDASAYYKLTGDIKNVTTTVGSVEHPFRGYFDGNGKTLTLNINSTMEKAAPFSVVNSATISNLTIDGIITSTNKFAGGLIGVAYGKSYITDCTNSVEIVSDIDMTINKKDGDATHGGFVGRNMENSTIYFDNCIFNGTIREVDPENPKTIKCAGFVGWRAGTISYTNCLQAGSIAVKGTTATFHRGGNTNSIFVNTFYLNVSGEEQGTMAGTTLPDDQVFKKYSVGKTDYYLSAVTIADLAQNSFTYTAKPFDINPVVTYGNKTLVKDTDYVISIQKKMDKGYEDVKEIQEIGEYNLVISGIGTYAGSHVITVSVVSLGNSWTDLQEALNEKDHVCLTQDYNAEDTDAVLSVNRSVVLDLNGYSINRGLKESVAEGNVITIGVNGDLTIMDSSDKKNGCITGGKNKGNGGGIINKGSLIIESGIISGNVSEAVGSNVYGTGGGVYNEGYRSSFCMKGGVIMDNVARGGGAGIHVKNAKLFRITGGEITGNTTPTKGGGVRVSDTEGSISNCTIAKNSTTDVKDAKGGGVYVEGKTLTLSDCMITGNSANVEGGAIFIIKSGKVIANNCTITDNVSKKGGCISVYDGTYTLNGGVYSGNTSTNKTNPVVNVETKSTFALAISNSAPNSLADLNQCTPSSVTLAGRTLWKDGDWNTLCLPFSLTEEQLVNSVLAGATIMELDVTDNSTNLDENGCLNLNFKKSSGIEAGKPYLIKWADGENLTEENLVFSGVTINSAANNNTSTDGKVSFMGTYDPITFTAEDKSVLFLGTENKLYYPDGKYSTTIGACCAYFKIGDGYKSKEGDCEVVDARSIISFNMNFNEGATGIVDVDREKTTDNRWYTLDGLQFNEVPVAKGVYVYRGRKIVKG